MHSFAWQRLEPGSELLLAITPIARLGSASSGTRLDFVFVLAFLVVLGTTLAVVGLLVRDVAGTTEQLQRRGGAREIG